jgi:hypothetical protein
MLYHGHSWKMCPFVHPGEPIQRRHPSTHRGDMCPALKKVGAAALSSSSSLQDSYNTHIAAVAPVRVSYRMLAGAAQACRASRATA